MRAVATIYKAPAKHWVGDGFPVRSMFSYQTHGNSLSPFLLLDYAEPVHFPPALVPRGVGGHPHRGFETVTLVYNGEVAHRDSTGKGGVISTGDVQWMTAGAGILHNEYHSEAFTASGGLMEMVQLWVNLPGKDKMAPPGYQAITQTQIPEIELADGTGLLRLVAGDFEGQQGAANTFSPMCLWDLRLKTGFNQRFSLPIEWNLALFVLSGTVRVGEQEVAGPALCVLSKASADFTISACTDAKVLVMGGEPLPEPVVGYGPFVMTSKEEIQQAFIDFQQGKFGQLAG